MITKLVLFRCNRFDLYKKEKIVYIPEKPIEIIIGTNGGGKTSLLEYLTPLPADIKNDFHDGGFKEIHYKIGHDEFILSSGIKGPTKHSFIMNGEELNSGYTKRVYLHLVSEYLKFDQDLFNILLGRQTFTKASPNERREWFTRMSNISYTYPIRVFNNLSSRVRDLKGSARIINNKLFSLDKDALTEEELDSLKKDKENLSEILENILTNLNTDRSSMYNEHELVEYTNKLKRSIKVLNNFPVIESKSNLERELEAVVKEIDDTITELEKIKERLSIGNLDKLRKEIQRLTGIINTITEEYTLPIPLQHLPVVNERLTSVHTEIERLLAEVTELVGVDVSQLTLKIDGRLLLNKSINDIVDNINRLKGRLSEVLSLKGKESIECPKCSHSFKIGYEFNEEVKIEKEIQLLEEKRDKKLIRLEALNEEIAKIEKKRELIASIEALLNEIHPLLKPWVVENEKLYETPVNISTRLFTAISQVRVAYPYTELKKSLEMYENELKVIERNNVDITEESVRLVSKKLKDLYRKKADITSRIDVADTVKRERENAKIYYDNILSNLKQLKQYKKEEIQDVFNKELRSLSIRIREHLNSIDEKINSIIFNKQRIKELEEELKDTEDKIVILQKALDALSPKTGLIAESISSFIGYIVKEMNLLIKSIWSYKMEILPPNIEDNDLNYKFRLKIEDGKERADISMGSEGMRELIDLVFITVMLKVRELDTPIYLDEFAKTFDPIHKNNAIEFIKMLMYRGHQIFYITHLSNMIHLDSGEVRINEIEKM